MLRIQQSIEVNVPAHAAYSQLARFEDYPRFMQDVDAVRRSDDTHLHWSTDMSGRQLEWDAEITEQRIDECIAWRNVSGPQNAGKVELQPIGGEKVCVTVTMECEPDQMPAGQGSNAADAKAVVAQRLEQDLVRFKKLLEGAAPQPDGLQAQRSTQSDYALAGSAADQAGQEQFSVAEEISFDQHSDQARRIGQLPQGVAADGSPGATPSDALAQSMQQDQAGANTRTGLTQSLDRALPPSEETDKGAPPRSGGKL